VGKRIPTVYYSFTKEIGTNALYGFALEELKFMFTSVLAGARNKQVIKINIIFHYNRPYLVSFLR